MFLDGVFSFHPIPNAGGLLPDSSASLCSLNRCFSIFCVPTAEKLDILGFGFCRQGLQTHFLVEGESRAWISNPCCQIHEVCLPARSDIVKPENLFQGKIFQSSGNASKLTSGAIGASQSGVCGRFTCTLASIFRSTGKEILGSEAGIYATAIFDASCVLGTILTGTSLVKEYVPGTSLTCPRSACRHNYPKSEDGFQPVVNVEAMPMELSPSI